MRHEAMHPAWTCLLALALAACATGGGYQGPREPEGSMSATGSANLQLAQNYLRTDQPQLALVRAQRAERSDPTSADVQVVMGMIYERVGNRGLAGEHYARAVRLAPDAGHVLNAQASWLCGAGQRDEADAMYLRAVTDQFYKGKEQAYSNAGKCALEGGLLDRAEAHLRAGLGLAPTNARLLELMAQLKFRQGDFMAARAFFERRDALGNPGPAMLDLAARIEQGAGDSAAAERYRSRLQLEHPGWRAPAAEAVP